MILCAGTRKAAGVYLQLTLDFCLPDRLPWPQALALPQRTYGHLDEPISPGQRNSTGPVRFYRAWDRSRCAGGLYALRKLPNPFILVSLAIPSRTHFPVSRGILNINSQADERQANQLQTKPAVGSTGVDNRNAVLAFTALVWLRPETGALEELHPGAGV